MLRAKSQNHVNGINKRYYRNSKGSSSNSRVRANK